MKHTINKDEGQQESSNTNGNENAAAKNQENKNNESSPNKSSAAINKENQSGQKETPLKKFFYDQLKDIYYVEQQLTKALPKMENAASADELKEAFNDHLHQTQKHVRRLEKIFNLVGKQAEAKRSEVIESLIKEAETIINETKERSATRDAALIVAAQKVEHFEIATYGGLVELALTLGLKEVSDILDTTLMEEEDTDTLLTDIAECAINVEAELEENFYS